MKPETIKATTHDRFATWDEIRHATSSTPDRLVELSYTDGNYCEVSSDLGGIIRYPSEEFEFFAYLSESDERVAN